MLSPSVYGSRHSAHSWASSISGFQREIGSACRPWIVAFSVCTAYDSIPFMPKRLANAVHAPPTHRREANEPHTPRPIMPIMTMPSSSPPDADIMARGSAQNDIRRSALPAAGLNLKNSWRAAADRAATGSIGCAICKTDRRSVPPDARCDDRPRGLVCTEDLTNGSSEKNVGRSVISVDVSSRVI